LDKYYTKKSVVSLCLSKVKEIERVYDCVIEPSAGNGAFYNAINHCNKFGIDIDPQHDNIEKADWLEYKIKSKYKNVLVVGNPPFGQYHKLSAAFITHAMSFNNVKTIAYVLPNVYKKHTRQKILPKEWRIVSITDLGNNAFILDGKEYHVPTSFFVFDKSKGNDLRFDTSKYKSSPDFSFSDKNNFDIFVFGASPKRITTAPKENNRGYYLKSNIPVAELVDRIKGINWTGNSCANGGVYWLTKYEFIEQYVNCHEPKRKGRGGKIYSGQHSVQQRDKKQSISC